MYNTMMKELALLYLLLFPATACGMANPWIEGSRSEITAQAKFNPPVALSIERCGNSTIWRYLKSDDLLEAICPRGGQAETKVRISRKPFTGDYVMYSDTSLEMYKAVAVSLKRRNAGGNYVRAEFHVKEYYYTLDIKPGTDLDAMMQQVRSIIDKISDF